MQKSHKINVKNKSQNWKVKKEKNNAKGNRGLSRGQTGPGSGAGTDKTRTEGTGDETWTDG